MLSCDTDCNKCSKCPERVKCNTSFPLAILSFFGYLLWILFSTPDDFRAGGKYFDTYPIWMDFVYITGIVATSALFAFITFIILYAIFSIKGIREWIDKKIQKLKVKRTYKFQ